VIIVNNGMGRFGRASMLAIVSAAIRAAAAVAFVALPTGGLAEWTMLYLAANAASLILAVLYYYPRQRLVLKTSLYFKRLPDALYVAGAEILFYLQMEFDKLLVLALGGAQLAGIYAIVMRLVDLTAIPIRAFTMMLVQKMMRAPETLAHLGARAGVEGMIFAVSTAALLSLAILLHFFPGALGRNVAEAAPLVVLAILVPGLRNLVEYEAELLFGRGLMLIRAFNLALLAGGKAVLLAWLLGRVDSAHDLVLALNGVFATVYLASAMLTYSALRLPPRTV
jgi:O-antigen/teichoic acid export membrane protein